MGVEARFSGRSTAAAAVPRTRERWSQREQWMWWLSLNKTRIHHLRAIRRVKSEPQSGHVCIIFRGKK
jgi:hypothetical protein